MRKRGWNNNISGLCCPVLHSEESSIHSLASAWVRRSVGTLAADDWASGFEKAPMAAKIHACQSASQYTLVT